MGLSYRISFCLLGRYMLIKLEHQEIKRTVFLIGKFGRREVARLGLHTYTQGTTAHVACTKYSQM